MVPWIFFVFTGNLFFLVRGISSAVKLGKFELEANWEKVESKAYDDVKQMHRKMSWWDLSLFDFTNIIGFIALFIFLILVLALWFGFSGRSIYGEIFIVNIATLFVPHWFSGTRSIDKRTDLTLKIKVINKLISAVKTDLAGCTVDYFMQLTGNAKRVPTDTKIRVQFENTPAEFMGMYGQLSLNSIGESKYPYFYVVLLAKSCFNLKDKFKNFDIGKKDIKEFSFQDDIEILVIRQMTTKTTGYHTSAKDVERVFRNGLNAGKLLVKKPKETTDSSPGANGDNSWFKSFIS
jgi:hypothetical protein